MLLNYIASFLLFILGLYVILTKKNLIKMIIGVILMNSGINLLLISVGFRVNGTSAAYITDLRDGKFFIDPIPQALTLTSIFISACITVIALVFILKVKEHYGTIDADKVRRMKG